MSTTDHLFILKALQDIPFGMGKKLLVEFLRGTTTHVALIRHRDLDSFGSLAYTLPEVERMVDSLIQNRLYGGRSSFACCS